MLYVRHGITINNEVCDGTVVLIYNATKDKYEQEISCDSYDQYYIVFCEIFFPDNELNDDYKDFVKPQTKYGITNRAKDHNGHFDKRQIRIGYRVHCEPYCTIYGNETYYTTHSSAGGEFVLAKTTVNDTTWYSGHTIDECITKCNDDDSHGNRCVRGASNFLELP